MQLTALLRQEKNATSPVGRCELNHPALNVEAFGFLFLLLLRVLPVTLRVNLRAQCHALVQEEIP